MVRRELPDLLAHLDPIVHPKTYVFVTAPEGDDALLGEAVAMVAEPEGRSLVVAREAAERRGLPFTFESAWITLGVHSALDAVGLTAAVATALAERGISGNVVAGHHHDHLFVPVERRDEALATLGAMSAQR